MSTLAIWCRVVQFRDVSLHNFDGLAMSGFAFSVAPQRPHCYYRQKIDIHVRSLKCEIIFDSCLIVVRAYMLGDDAYGRKVIVLSACRLPARVDIDHEKLLM